VGRPEKVTNVVTLSERPNNVGWKLAKINISEGYVCTT
jgi:hypothetical protein